MSKLPRDTINIVEQLNALVQDRYTEIDPDTVDGEAREVVEALNLLYRQKRDQQQAADQGLRSAEERLRRIVESTPVGICITNAERRFEYVNPQYCRLYRYERDELIGMPFTMVVPEHHREEMIRLHDEFIAGNTEMRGEWEVVRKDGSPLAILADAAHITDVDGRPKKVTFVMDITQRKQAEEDLRQANEQLQREVDERLRIERTQREVERIIRHDLRNPLNGVFTASELLNRTDLDEEQKDLLRIVRDSGQRLKNMIDSSLDLAKMEQGIFTLEPQAVEIQEMLLAVQSQLLGMMGERRVSLKIRINGEAMEDTAPAVIEGEAQYLENLFANLVRNAIEASPEGHVVTVDVQEEAEDFLFAIHNSGVIPETVRDRFFERNSSYGKPDGNGIGTFVAALIASVHKGSIWFETDEAAGTDLYVRLPKKQPAPA